MSYTSPTAVPDSAKKPKKRWLEKSGNHQVSLRAGSTPAANGVKTKAGIGAHLMVNAQADALTGNESWEMSMVDISLSRVRAFNAGDQHRSPSTFVKVRS